MKYKKLMTFNIESGYIFFAIFQSNVLNMKGCYSLNKFNVNIQGDKDSLF